MKKSKAPVKKRGPGRPKEHALKDEYFQRLVDHMAKPASYESFAHVIGVTRSTLYDWETRYEGWKEAKERGELARLYTLDMGLAGAIRGEEVNVSALIFAYKAMHQIGLNATSSTIVQIKNEVRPSTGEDARMLGEFKDILVSYVDERKEPAR